MANACDAFIVVLNSGRLTLNSVGVEQCVGGRTHCSMQKLWCVLIYFLPLADGADAVAAGARPAVGGAGTIGVEDEAFGFPLVGIVDG